jgi:hypothetical protein
MPSLISRVRASVAAASKHALWYLDWRTGGSTAREAGARR